MHFHPVTFTNPANAETYVWPNNPDWDAETKAGSGYQQKQRQIERTSNTGNVGATKQQGDDGPFIIHWEFIVYSAAHEEALYRWYQTCSTQSIYLTDFNGERYEGQITTAARARQGAAGGPGDIQQRGYYTQFVMEFEVWRFLTGTLKDSGVFA